MRHEGSYAVKGMSISLCWQGLLCWICCETVGCHCFGGMPWCGLNCVRRSPPSLRPAIPQKICIWKVYDTEVVAQ